MRKYIFKHIGKKAKERNKAFVLWFTGLSGSGKSTIAVEVEKKLYDRGIKTVFLDGDNLRTGLNKDLGFSPTDRKENIRRAGEVAKLFFDSGIAVIASFISPYIEDRNTVRKLFKKGSFIEIFVKCHIRECKKRDVKGLYKKVSTGKISQFTGLSAPYEEPKNPEIILESDKKKIAILVEEVMAYLLKHQLI